MPAATSEFDLLLRFVEDDGLTLTVQYDATLFARETVDRVLEAMAAVLNYVVSCPDEPLSSAALVRPADLAALAALWQSLTDTEFDTDAVLESVYRTEFFDLVEKRGLLTALLLAL